MARNRMLRASEIGAYMYCHRAWWLQYSVGEEPVGHQRRRRGVALHRQHGRTVWATQVLLLISIVLACTAVLLIVIH